MRSVNAKSLVPAASEEGKLLNFWNAYLVPIGLPLLLALGLGPLLAALIVSEKWTVFALAIPFLIPLIILLVRYPFAGIIIWMAVMPWFRFEGMYKYIYYSAHRALIPLALGLVIMTRMLRLKKYPPFRLQVAELSTLAFGAMGLISIISAGKDYTSIMVLHDQFLVPFMAYWLVRLSNAGEKHMKRLMPLILLVSLGEYSIALVSWFFPQALPEIWNFTTIGSRTAGTFSQPAIYASVLLFFLVYIYHNAMGRAKGFNRTAEILVFALGLVCLFFTFTRGAWLAGLFVLLGLLILYFKPTASLVAVVMLIMAILSTGVLAGEFAHAADRLASTEEGGEARLVLANAGKKMFYARPVFGWGFGNYDRYDWKFMERVGETTPTKWQVQEGTSHHTYLTILAEMGVVGLFFYALPVIWWLALSFKAFLRLPNQGYWSRRWLVALWLPMVAHIMIAQDLDMRFFYYCLTLFWINLGFIANIVQTAFRPREAGVAG
jgi:O-antigen ligase